MMKKKAFSLALAVLMLFSVMTGCQKKEAPVAADAVAEALFQMILKNDASSAVELFGYASEEDARKDMGLDGDLYDEMAKEVVSQFSAMGITASTEDVQTFIDAFISMFKEVEMTAKVKDMDEKAGTAVVTCTISTFDPNGIENAMGQVMQEIMADEDLLAGDEAELYSAMLNKISAAIAELKPTDNTTDFDVDFVLEKHTINGKDRQVWMPKDVNGFGAAIGSNAMGA